MPAIMPHELMRVVQKKVTDMKDGEDPSFIPPSSLSILPDGKTYVFRDTVLLTSNGNPRIEIWKVDGKFHVSLACLDRNYRFRFSNMTDASMKQINISYEPVESIKFAND